MLQCIVLQLVPVPAHIEWPATAWPCMHVSCELFQSSREYFCLHSVGLRHARIACQRDNDKGRHTSGTKVWQECHIYCTVTLQQKATPVSLVPSAARPLSSLPGGRRLGSAAHHPPQEGPSKRAWHASSPSCVTSFLPCLPALSLQHSSVVAPPPQPSRLPLLRAVLPLLLRAGTSSHQGSGSRPRWQPILLETPRHCLSLW
jgi:hypothetical protein